MCIYVANIQGLLLTLQDTDGRRACGTCKVIFGVSRSVRVLLAVELASDPCVKAVGRQEERFCHPSRGGVGIFRDRLAAKCC